MKRFVAILLMFLITAALFGCIKSSRNDNTKLSETLSNVTENNITPETQNIPKTIVDITVPDVPLMGVAEDFFEDDKYIYVFSFPKSEITTVKYSDGSEQKLADALKDGNTKISDLDTFGIKYYTRHKNIQKIVDRTETEPISTSTALEPFFEDEYYTYCFPSIKSQYIIVYFRDGTEKPIIEALKDGSATLTDMNYYKIFYYANPKPIKNPTISYEMPFTHEAPPPTDIQTLYNTADLVIEGTYKETISSYATKSGQVRSTGRITDFKILKGELKKGYKLNFLEAVYYGGTISVSNFMRYADPEVSEKYGFDKLSKFDADTKYIGTPKTKTSVNPTDGARYLIFIKHDPKTGSPCILCDGYGIREINSEGMVWNLDLGEYETVNFVK